MFYGLLGSMFGVQHVTAELFPPALAKLWRRQAWITHGNRNSGHQGLRSGVEAGVEVVDWVAFYAAIGIEILGK